jgi:hypothetical protein
MEQLTAAVSEESLGWNRRLATVKAFMNAELTNNTLKQAPIVRSIP